MLSEVYLEHTNSLTLWTEEAIAALQEARKSNPNDVNLILVEADLYVKLDRMDKFGELMELAVKQKPNDPTLYYNLGVVNMNQKKKEEAKKEESEEESDDDMGFGLFD